MVNDYDKKRWELFQKRREGLYCWGIKNGLIKPYDEDLLKRLREVYCGGLPISLLILHEGLSNGHCYDRGTAIALGFGDDDFRIVDADIDDIKLNPAFIKKFNRGKDDEHYGNHCFAERTMSDGSVWVYDTSVGLVFEKNLYYRMEHPIITTVNDKEATLAFLKEDFVREDIERDKYALPLILPMIEDSSKAFPYYEKAYKRELALLKKRVGYDELVREVQSDMARMFSRKG